MSVIDALINQFGKKHSLEIAQTEDRTDRLDAILNSDKVC